MSGTTRYIALLRAINVGGHVVKMERLRALFEALGFDGVATYIASGNVIFDSPAGDSAALERDIAAHLQTALGYEVATFIRSTEELARIAAYQPFPDDGLAAAGASLYIGFLAEPLTAAAEQTVLAGATAVDDFHVHQREIYWRCRIKMSESTFSPGRLERTLGIRATFRNATTVQKLAERYPAPTP